MADRPFIPNSTIIPNIVLDVLMAQLSPSEFKVLMYLCRRTYGFWKKRDAVSLSQLADGIETRDGRRIDFGTGLSRPTVIKAIKSLEAMGLVKVKRVRIDEKHNAINVYELNTDAEVVKDFNQEVEKYFNYVGQTTLPPVDKEVDRQNGSNQNTSRQNSSGIRFITGKYSDEIEY